MNKKAFAKIHLTPAERLEQETATAAFELQLATLNPASPAGYFTPGCMTWKLFREPTVLLGGISALLLQIAHPAIAEGVRQFSNFHEEYLYRAHRTFMSMSKFYFGSVEQANHTARRLFGMHSMIRGTVGKNVNGLWEQQAFCARDPELLTWVLATLVETGLNIYQKVHGPLPIEEQEQFFEESKIIAVLMGIPLVQYPEDLNAFKKYYTIMLNSGILKVTPTNMRLAQIILHPPYGSNRVFKTMAGVFLPENLATAYHIYPSTKQQRWVNHFIKALHFGLRMTPPFFRYAPPYHQAVYRACKDQGGWYAGQFYNLISKHFKFPFGLSN